MPKILQIMPEFGLAGAEIMCENLVLELVNKYNYSVVIVSLYNYHSSITERLEREGVPIYYLNKKKGIDISIINKIRKIINEEKIDIIHTHRYTMQYAVPAGIMTGIKSYVHTIHNIATKEVNYYRRKFASLMFKFEKAIPVGISPIVVQTISKEYGLPLSSIPMIYNGIDLSRCLPKNNYEVKDRFQFIHIGRFSKQKNHRVLIRALKLLVDAGYNVVLNLIGDGTLFEECKKEVINYGIEENVIFHGIIDNVYPLLNRSDCFILPSLYEGMPISLIEAMGTGLPIIASNVGGIPDMIKNEISGIIIEPNEIDLFNSMRRIITNSKFRECIGSKALEDSMKFSVQEMTRNYVKIYKDLIITS